MAQPSIQVSQVVMAVISAALGAMATWALKIEDRVYNLAINTATKHQVENVERSCNLKNSQLGFELRRLRERMDEGKK